MGMISCSWQNTQLVCGNHGDDCTCPMNLEYGQKGVFYACEHYNDVGASHCHNKIEIADYEKMLSHIADKLIDADNNNIVLNLHGYKWKRKDTIFQVVKHTGDEFVIRVLNKKSLAK